MSPGVCVLVWTSPDDTAAFMKSSWSMTGAQTEPIEFARNWLSYIPGFD